MQISKTWLILGAVKGLGAAAVKYLIANHQTVIAVVEADSTSDIFAGPKCENLLIIKQEKLDISGLIKQLKAIGIIHGSIDYIIDNSNFMLFQLLETIHSEEISITVSNTVTSTVKNLTALMPFLRKPPAGCLISIPPQLCLMSVNDPIAAANLAVTMEMFLRALKKELMNLNCSLKFLEPGERLNSLEHNTID